MEANRRVNQAREERIYEEYTSLRVLANTQSDSKHCRELKRISDNNFTSSAAGTVGGVSDDLDSMMGEGELLWSYGHQRLGNENCVEVMEPAINFLQELDS